MDPSISKVILENENRIFVALIALIGSVIVTLFNAAITVFSAYRNAQAQKDVERLKAELTAKNEDFKSSLSTWNAELDARRDYEYEARKRLYQELEPLLFQLMEYAESAQYRIWSIARASRQGDLLPDGTGWLKEPRYYMRSTIYRLLCPLATVKLLQRKLTMVDLSVDPRIERIYLLAKALYWTLSDHFDLAQQTPPIKYAPYDKVTDEERATKPGQYVLQGVPIGMLDNAANCLFDSDEPKRLISFGEFEQRFEAQDKRFNRSLSIMIDVFTGFHPDSRPVLWRSLIAQAYLYEELLRRGRIGDVDDNTPVAFKFDLSSIVEYDWQPGNSTAPEIIARPEFEAAAAYLKISLQRLHRLPKALISA